MSSFLASGTGEDLKATIHAASGGLLMLVSAYNILAFWQRREAHLLVHGVLYGALAVYEASQVTHHLRSWRDGF